MKLLAWGLSDVGRRRERNEDSHIILADRGLFVVADGMGGHQGGAKASGLAVQILDREMLGVPMGEDGAGGPSVEAPPAQHLRSAAAVAGRAIFDIAEGDPDLMGMGTTLTALLVHGGRAYLAHVGDSRAYLFRDDRIEQLTEDHSWIEEQVRAGLISPEEAENSSFKHVITRSVGFEREVEVDIVVLPFLMGDLFLLCSDGLSNHFTEEELRQRIHQHYYAELPGELVAEANERGGDDNITVVVVYVANEGEEG